MQIVPVFPRFLPGKYNLNPDYVKEAGNILHCWGMLLVIIVVFALLSVVLLEFIDRDKR